MGEAPEPEPEHLVRLMRLLTASVGPFDTLAWYQATIWSCHRHRVRPRDRTSMGWSSGGSNCCRNHRFFRPLCRARWTAATALHPAQIRSAVVGSQVVR